MISQEQIERFLDSIDPEFRAGGPDADEEAQARHVAILQDVFAAIGRGDFDAMADACCDDVELDIAGPPSVPFVGVWKGRDDVVAAIRRNFAMLEGQRPEIESLSAQGDHVILILRERGRYIATGAAYSWRAAQVFTFDGGKIRRIREIVVEEPT
jgi:ketosteroid isomerase-like protein